MTSKKVASYLQNIWLIALLVSLPILLWGSLKSPWFAFDDAFITYRYSENLSQGIGFVYNPGEAVLGITTPLYGLLLAFLGLFLTDIVVVSHWVSILAWAALAWGCLFLFWPTSRSTAVAAALIISANPVIYPAIGMETSLLIALMIWTAWAWQNGRFLPTIILAALTLLTRQDSAVWLLLLGLAAWQQTKIFPWREGVGTTLLTLPWFGFAWWFYGSPLPNSASAKIGQTGLMPVADLAPFYESYWQTLTGSYPLWFTLGLVTFIAIGLWAIARQTTHWWLAAWTVLYVLIYTILQVVSFPWYFAPPTITLLMIGAIGFGYVWEHTPHNRPLWRIIALLVWGTVVTLQAETVFTQSQQRGTRASYGAAARWLNENTPQDASLATIEIGLLGYQSQRPIVDTMGLISLDMTAHQVGWVETLVYAIEAYEPDYALALPHTAWDSVVNQWWFQERYQPIAQFEDTTLYQRQETAVRQSWPQQSTFADGIKIQGLEVTTSQIEPGQVWSAWLNVEAYQNPSLDYQFTIYLQDSRTYEWLATQTITPFDGMYKTSRWQPGDQLSLPFQIEIPPTLPNGSYHMGVVVYAPEVGNLGLQDTPQQPAEDRYLGWLHTAQPPRLDDVTQTAPEWQASAVAWSNGITLKQVAIQTHAQAGTAVPVSLAWEASRPTERDLKVFIHLLDENNEIVAQSDAYPFQGRWSTAVWGFQANQPFTDQHTVQLPEELAAGQYRVRLGFYDGEGQLPLADSDNRFILLEQSIEIR